MTRLVRIELLKLTTVRLSYGLLATAALLTAFFCTLEAARSGAGKSVAPLSTYSGQSTIVTGGVWGLLFAAVLGATAVSGEFRHQTATLTYLATPDRNRVLMAKSIAAALAGAVFGLVGYFVATAVGLGFVAAHGYHVSIGAVTFARFGAGHIVAGVLLGAVGAALGSLIRSQLAAVIGILVWAIAGESLIGGLFTSARPYLPYTDATTLAGTVLGYAGFGPSHNVSGGVPLPFAAAALLLAGLAAVLAAVASAPLPWAGTVRRDIA